jgi:hypothetical protein
MNYLNQNRCFILKIEISVRDIKLQIARKVYLICNFPGRFKFIVPTLEKE